MFLSLAWEGMWSVSVSSRYAWAVRIRSGRVEEWRSTKLVKKSMRSDTLDEGIRGHGLWTVGRFRVYMASEYVLMS